MSATEGVAVTSGLSGWLPFLGLAGVMAAAGATLGVVGTFTADPAPTSAAAVTIPLGVGASACPGSSAITTLPAGLRVYAIEQSEDGTYVSVRDPQQLGRTVWVPAAAVTVDASEPALGGLPVGGCLTGSEIVALPSPSATPTETTAAPEPTGNATTPPPPPPPSDTVNPVVSVGSFSPTTIFGMGAPACATVSTVVVTATDDTGVTSVTGSSTTPGSVITLVSHAGSQYTFSYSATDPASTTVPSVRFEARDAAGNTASASRTLVLQPSSADNCVD